MRHGSSCRTRSQDLGDQSLTDQGDADYAALQPAYHIVQLTDLDGSGFLRGSWAEIVSETGSPAYSPTNTFLYNRHQDEFEQVMAYFWITEAQRYIQSLGFGSRLRAVNDEPQRVRINQWGADNSFATTHKDEIRLGKGGVDDAEDAEVVLHEYGHAVHFAQGFSFSTDEAGAISEGFGDYLRRHGLRGRPREARPPRVLRPGLRRRLGRGLVHVDRAALPAARRPRPPLPGGPPRRGARGRADLVARAVGPSWRAGREGRRHGRPRGAVRLRRRDDARARGRTRSRPRGASTATPRPTGPRRSSRPGASSADTSHGTGPRPGPVPGGARGALRMEESGHARRCTNHARTHLGGG